MQMGAKPKGYVQGETTGAPQATTQAAPKEDIPTINLDDDVEIQDVPF